MRVTLENFDEAVKRLELLADQIERTHHEMVVASAFIESTASFSGAMRATKDHRQQLQALIYEARGIVRGIIALQEEVVKTKPLTITELSQAKKSIQWAKSQLADLEKIYFEKLRPAIQKANSI